MVIDKTDEKMEGIKAEDRVYNDISSIYRR